MLKINKLPQAAKAGVQLVHLICHIHNSEEKMNKEYQ